MCAETERPRQKPLPCSANPVSHQVAQLRNGLVKAIANASLVGPGTEDAVTQLRVALGALEEALVLLANYEPENFNCHRSSKNLSEMGGKS